MSGRRIDINVPVLTRVEGEGALQLSIRDDRIENLQLRIYEPPRFFEKLLEGRDCHEVPDMVARICGICPVAYQMSAVNAIESIFGLEVSPWSRDMRRAMYCGEWLQSHALHIHMLAAPDYLGAGSILELARTHPAEVRRGLRLQALGNDLISLFGGRSVHPVGVRPGGFHHAPTVGAVRDIVERLRAAMADTEELVLWTATLDLPDDEQSFTSVSLREPDRYPMSGGRIVSDNGLDIDIADWETHFRETQVPHSTALHSLLHGEPYLLGPLARLNLNHDRLPADVRALVQATSIRFPSRNMFHSIVARAVEMHYAVLEAFDLLKDYRAPARCHETTAPRAGTGFGATEAPRGLLWHRYRLDAQGRVQQARIVPPTSQNQARIEQDLRHALQHFGLQRADRALELHAEKVIRNYDPCISCATHFLALDVERLPESVAPGVTAPADDILHVVGAGSSSGPDRLGRDVVRKLAADPELATQPRLAFHLLDSPATGLPALLETHGRLILIDAVNGAGKRRGAHGRLVETELEADGEKTAALSSHAIGVTTLLALRGILSAGTVAAPVRLFALDTGGDTHTPFDNEAIEALTARVKSYLLRTLAAANP